MRKQKMTTFEQALLDATLEEFADIPEKEAEIDVTFSPAFAAKSEKLLQNTQRKSWRHVNATMKRVALVAILAALLLTTAMAIPAVREEVIRFFIREEGTHLAFTFDPEQAAHTPESIETVHMPTYLPDGYREDTRSTSASSVYATWRDQYGNAIVYHQLPVSNEPCNSELYGISSNGSRMRVLFLNGYKVLSVQDGCTISYMWTDREYFYDLSCSSAVSQKEIIQIFGSIEVDEDAVITGAD